MFQTARNPKNAADAVELAAMEFYRKNKDVKEQFILVDDDEGEEYYHYTQPIWIEEYCLKCHGKPEDAPASIQARYAASYGYKLGDLRGVMSIKLPAKDAYALAWAVFWKNIAVNLFGYTGAFIVIYVVLLRTAVNRLKVLEQGSKELANTNYSWRSDIDGNDEISNVAAAFDQMAQRIGEREAELKEIQEQFRHLVEATPDAMVIVDLQGIIVLSNKQTKSVFGYEVSEVIGQKIELLIPHRYREKHIGQRDKFMQAPVDRGMGIGMELSAVRKDGTEFPVEVSLNVIETQEGNLIASAIRDITERKHAEEEARQYREELAHVTRISTMGEMATGLAHELNQPLATIATYSHIVKQRLQMESELDPEVLRAFEQLEGQSIRAGKIVRRLRDFVKKTNVSCILADVNELVREVAKFVDNDVRSAEVSLILNLSEPGPTAYIDEIQIQQVLVNLIKNAIEATQGNSADRRVVSVSTHSDDSNTVEVVVTDSGIGVDSADIDSVFEAFYSTKSDGMGMGLAISRSIIENHGGKLSVEPNDGPGVTFRFSIPQKNN